jgi:hypothetical protein
MKYLVHALLFVIAPAAHADPLDDFDAVPLVVTDVHVAACEDAKRLPSSEVFSAAYAKCYGNKSAVTAVAAMSTAADTLIKAATSSVSGAVDCAKLARSKNNVDAAIAFRTVQQKVWSPSNRSPTDFERLLEDPDRRAACRLLHDLRGVQRKNGASPSQAAESAHRTDILRKAGTLLSGFLGSNGNVEAPGSPDRVSFAVMSALGADEETDGSQILMTLNLASLLFETEKDRLAASPLVRNLFLRMALPLEATDETLRTQAPGDEDSLPEEMQDSVARFSAILGGSLDDDADTRLKQYRDCYESALDYLPFSVMREEALAEIEERKIYYDACNRRAVNAQRLSWRLAIGFITQNRNESPKTEWELVSAAAVWGPASWVYVNAFGQRVRLPVKGLGFGGGLSIGGNAGGLDSGVDSWGRFTLEMIFSVSKPDDADYVWQARIAPRAQFRLFGDSIGSFSVGPVLFGDDIDDVGVVANVGFSYDADALIEPLLSPPR